MNKVLFYISIVFLIFFNSCNEPPTEAPEIITQITGKVTDGQTNVPLVGVQISTSPVTSSIITGQDGNYTIPNISPGQFAITATKNGYNPASTSVTVSEGNTVTADIQMIQQGPELEVSTLTLDYETALTNLTFTINNKTKVGTVTWQVASNQSWITLAPGNGTTTTESDVISVGVSRDSMNFGNYSGVITITSDYGSKQITVIMTKQNPSAPQLTLVPTTIDLGSTNNNQILSIKNTGTGNLNWIASTSANWILLSNSAGTSVPNAPSNITVSVNKSGLQANNYEGLVLINSNGGNLSVLVKMTVEPGTLNPPTLQLVGTPTTSSISIGWTVISDPTFSSYKIFRSLTAGVTENSTLVTTVTNANQNNFTDNNLNSSTIYYYRVFVYNNTGVGSGSNEINPTTAIQLRNWILQKETVGTTYYGIGCLTENNCWAVGSNTQDGIISHWDGSTWNTTSYPDISSIGDIEFLNSNEGYALARSKTGYISLMKYNGIGWTVITSNIIYYSAEVGQRITVPESNLVYIVNYNKNIIKYNGIDFTQMSVGSDGFTSIDHLSTNDVWAINYSSEIFRFNGFGWFKDDVLSQSGLYGPSRIIVNNSNEVYLSSSNYQKYKFDGTNWNLIKSSLGSELQVIAFDVLSDSYGWAFPVLSYGSPKCYFYNGSNFVKNSNPTSNLIYDVEMINANSGWAVGEKGTILRYN